MCITELRNNSSIADQTLAIPNVALVRVIRECREVHLPNA
jgi:hypothetical protein